MLQSQLVKDSRESQDWTEMMIFRGQDVFSNSTNKLLDLREAESEYTNIRVATYPLYTWEWLFRSSQPETYKATSNERTGNGCELSRSRRRDDEKERGAIFRRSQNE